MQDLMDGESVEMKGSAAKPYVLKNTGGVYSCTCPAWRNQSVPIEKRTCKHLRKLRGDAAEQERVGAALPRKPKEKSVADASPPLLLAQSWDTCMDLAGWWMSEKLDGVRAYWDGKQFLSRQGNNYMPPDWFCEGLPPEPLDGELWLARKAFQRTVSIVRRQDKSDQWRQVRYLVFDAPGRDEAFEKRLEYLRTTLDRNVCAYAQFHEQQLCKGMDHMRQELARVEALGGEGLMMRQPGSTYESGRSHTLLKIKSFHDAEAEVLGIQPGKGKHKGRMGALLVQLADGTRFSVGTGFSDAERADPPPEGSTITFRYQELSDSGVPRFPSYVCTRNRTQTAAAPSRPASIQPAQAVSADSGEARYFELVDDKSSKFWEISQAGTSVTIHYGRIGADGQSKTKTFASADAARAEAEKLIGQKTRKGYEEKK